MRRRAVAGPGDAGLRVLDGAMQIGVNHYLGKPFQEHELLKTIHRQIGIPMAEELEQANVYG